MIKRHKRLISVILAVLLTVSLLPVLPATADADGHILTDIAELTDGTQVVIFNPSYMTALSTLPCADDPHYNGGAHLTSHNGVLAGFSDTEIWTAEDNGDGTYSFFDPSGRKLSMDSEHTYMGFDKLNDRWSITAAEGGFYINNVGRNAENSYRMEWVGDDGFWCCYHRNNSGAAFVLGFYLITEEEHEDPYDCMELYFGQLHSHTAEYSDGTGTLEEALSYVAALPESENVDFFAVTDHSNFFDSTKNANPEAALYDMSLAGSECAARWEEYRSTVAEFNAGHDDLVALAGFEMTWSSGPGHINTFNTPGIVSRNNKTLNAKGSDAGLRAYYELLGSPELEGSISQFNHPGKTFGTFADFDYWSREADSRICLIEVANGNGAVGSSTYYPSYEYYTMALDRGWHLAPTIGQDNHTGRWGNANTARDVILTDDLSEEGIYEALRSMRVYATEDKNLEIRYSVNGLPLGSIISEVPDELDFALSVYDPDENDAVKLVELVANSGSVVYSWSDVTDTELELSLAPEYSYYYVRVTELDGDIAVTAPVWVGKSMTLGVSELTQDVLIPTAGTELGISAEVFSFDTGDAAVRSARLFADGTEVSSFTDCGTLSCGGKMTLDFAFTPSEAKPVQLSLSVVMELDGCEYEFTREKTLCIVSADELIYIGIDASHYNEYVSGHYSECIGNFTLLAAEKLAVVNVLNTSEELISACTDSRYRAIFFSVPSRRDGAGLREDYASYSQRELAAIAGFGKNGGTVIVTGWGDIYEGYAEFAKDRHMSAEQNRLLAALGSSLRISDDTLNDDVMAAKSDMNNGTRRLYYSSYCTESRFLAGVELDPEHPDDNMFSERFSQYAGTSIYAVDINGAPTDELPMSVIPAVFAHESTVSLDMDNDGRGGESTPEYAFSDGTDRHLVLAAEHIEGRGDIIAAGGTFFSDYEITADSPDNGSEKQYSNRRICENIIDSLRDGRAVTIAAVRAAESGVFTVEGRVTADSDTVYIQDSTGGIRLRGSAGDCTEGDLVRVSGEAEIRNGEPALRVSSLSLLAHGKALTADRISAERLNGRRSDGRLVSFRGTVKSIEYSGDRLRTVTAEDALGKTAIIRADFDNKYKEDIKLLSVGNDITVRGIAAYELSSGGPFILVGKAENIVCTLPADSPFTDIGGSFYRGYITQGAFLGLVGGYPDGTYRPGTPVTRAQLITMLWRAAGEPYAGDPELVFADSGSIAKCYLDAVKWGYSAGIIRGFEDNTFRPDIYVSRAQTATFIYRYMLNEAGFDFGTVPAARYADSEDILPCYETAIAAMSFAGIMNGVGNGRFAPNGTADRGQAVTVLIRMTDIA